MFVLVGDWAFARGRVRSARRLHLELLARLLRAPSRFFDSTPIGRLLNRFSKDMEVIDVTLPQMIKWFLLCLFDVVSIVFVISFSMPLFLTSIVPLFLLYYVTQVREAWICADSKFQHGVFGDLLFFVCILL